MSPNNVPTLFFEQKIAFTHAERASHTENAPSFPRLPTHSPFAVLDGILFDELRDASSSPILAVAVDGTGLFVHVTDSWKCLKSWAVDRAVRFCSDIALELNEDGGAVALIVATASTANSKILLQKFFFDLRDVHAVEVKDALNTPIVAVRVSPKNNAIVVVAANGSVTLFDRNLALCDVLHVETGVFCVRDDDGRNKIEDSFVVYSRSNEHLPVRVVIAESTPLLSLRIDEHPKEAPAPFPLQPLANFASVAWDAQTTLGLFADAAHSADRCVHLHRRHADAPDIFPIRRAAEARLVLPLNESFFALVQTGDGATVGIYDCHYGLLYAECTLPQTPSPAPWNALLLHGDRRIVAASAAGIFAVELPFSLNFTLCSVVGRQSDVFFTRIVPRDADPMAYVRSRDTRLSAEEVHQLALVVDRVAPVDECEFAERLLASGYVSSWTHSLLMRRIHAAENLHLYSLCVRSVADLQASDILAFIRFASATYAAASDEAAQKVVWRTLRRFVAAPFHKPSMLAALRGLSTAESLFLLRLVVQDVEAFTQRSIRFAAAEVVVDNGKCASLLRFFGVLLSGHVVDVLVDDGSANEIVALKQRLDACAAVADAFTAIEPLFAAILASSDDATPAASKQRSKRASAFAAPRFSRYVFCDAKI